MMYTFFLLLFVLNVYLTSCADNGTVIDIYDIIGRQMCLKQCAYQTRCLSVVYCKSKLVCELRNNDSDDVTTDSDCDSIQMSAKVLPSIDLNNCIRNYYCRNLGENKEACVPHDGSNQLLNLARNAVAFASSVYRNMIDTLRPDFAIDGQHEITPINRDCFHSDEGDYDPWFRLDLGGVYKIQQIVLHGGWYPLVETEIRVGNDDNWSTTKLCGYSRRLKCAYGGYEEKHWCRFENRNGSTNDVIRCPKCVLGKFVEVRMRYNKTMSMNICEIEVLGRRP